ncbi:hypothetical protein QBC34DRAFT_398531 [Podospora aff. communis PSN243]|uniref:rRNA methyltransferase 1, mitochondrial n=1 Tax=Podospora aff. communis PSN243 TaxID=3040156 RepID=A0AAV9GUN1_9PEZI|nr:hypothetical protein QBC34DRAFT_398531 [Podospora aff. communis PSN243]
MSLTSLTSLCRALRPLTLDTPSSFRTYASLSGIHNGIRRSERVRPQGARLSDDGKPLTYRQRQQARKEAPKPTFRIRKGKKDITEDPNESKSQSRRARFFDPESSFGKKSLVYKLKSGELQRDLESLQQKEKARDQARGTLNDVFAQRIKPAGSDFVEPKKERKENRWQGRGVSRGAGRSKATGGSRSIGGASNSSGPLEFSRAFERGSPRESTPRDFSQAFERRPRRESEGARSAGVGASRDEGRARDAPQTPTSRSDFEERPRREQRDHRDHPISIPYTTAASQFLYGKSVVEAALQGGRRQLYKLYIYRGRNTDTKTAGTTRPYQHDRTPQDAIIERLALAKKVEIVKLGDEGLRLMDKMSGGRPHNNYILEASPLPQVPVVALGPLSSAADKPGFSIDRAHQSAEELALTGSSDFIPTPANDTHKPLVVVLHGVLDPGNVGAILRSASFLGATAIATTKRGSAPLTPVALKAAAGASETLTLLSIDSIERFLEESRDNGWTVYAAVPPPANGKHPRPHMDMREVEEQDPLREKPCVLVLGSEGEGLGKQVLRRTDCDVNIPNVLGTEIVDSLNVSVAAGLLCNAFLRGKMGEKMRKEKAGQDTFSLF